ncbi:MAG: hypothetical protein HWN65_22490 [Candidatus Helarchaeota archaeon]|nr:hypothetical protein [Candidatus Helarchaeota archaeon]
MATTAEILQKLDNLKTMIDDIPNGHFKYPQFARAGKIILKGLVILVKEHVSQGTPNDLNNATYLLDSKLRPPLDASLHCSWLKAVTPHPEIIRLINEIIQDIQSLYTNEAPIPIIKIAPLGEVPQPVPPASTYRVKLNEVYIYDATDSYDPDVGQAIHHYKWDFGDGTIKESEAVVEYAYTTLGGKPCTLEVTDNGTPPESNSTWVLIDPYM